MDDVLAKVQEGKYTRVVREPSMIVAGDHANNDMAGNGEGFWKDVFEKADYEVVLEVRGLGEMEGIRNIKKEDGETGGLSVGSCSPFYRLWTGADEDTAGGDSETVASAEDMVTPDIVVEDDQAWDYIIWSSSNYDYIKVDEVQHDMVNQEIGLQGNSAIRIPVVGFDFKMPVKANTTAMSTPREIDYTLEFDADSISEAP